jgi:hypothetical protein
VLSAAQLRAGSNQAKLSQAGLIGKELKPRSYCV